MTPRLRVRLLSRRLALGVVTCLALTAFGSRPATAQKKSVKPGINKSFENPNVEQFVERFEREGREIYDQREKVAQACGVREGMSIADVGAGTGLYTRLFAKRVGPKGRVYAVDIAKKFVDYVERTSREQQLKNVVGVVCKPDSVELPANSVDMVFICDTYHHFEFPQLTMGSIYRALRPGGTACVIDFQRIRGTSSDWVLNHVRAGQEVFRKEIEEAGFVYVRDVKLFKQNYFMLFRKPKK